MNPVESKSEPLAQLNTDTHTHTRISNYLLTNISSSPEDSFELLYAVDRYS